MKVFFISIGMLLSSSSFSQYCTSGGPTSTVDSNVLSVQLTGSSGSINHSAICPGVLGVQILTNLTTTLNAPNAYTLNVQFGTCNGNYFGAGEAWIDFDQSNTFDPSESIGTWSGTPPVALSVFNFSVPAGAQNGTTRMRVIQQEAGALPLDPCASFLWGSVMDFSIVISGGIDCSAYIGDDTLDPIIVPSIPYTHNGDNSYCYGNQNFVYPSPDVYYLVVPSPGSQSIHASLCGSSFDTFLSVIDSTGTVFAYNDDATTCAPQSDLTFSTIGLDSIYIIVEGWGNQSGTYTLQLTENFVGVSEYLKKDFSIFPNPAKNYFVIQGNVRGAIQITDVLGNVISQSENYNGEQISTLNYSPGIYFVQFSNSGRNYSEKIIIIE